jgi:LysM domain
MKRFAASLTALAAVTVGIPYALIGLARGLLTTSNPLPEHIGTAAEIRRALTRSLSSADVIPMLVRVMLIAGWIAWAALMITVMASLLREVRPSARVRLPRFGFAVPLARWIVAGLIVTASISRPTSAHASLPPLRTDMNVAAVVMTAPARPAVETPAAAGTYRVQPSESAAMIAGRFTGDEDRWRELWDLNRNGRTDTGGDQWEQPWLIQPGWTLQLPTTWNTTDPPGAASHVVVAGDTITDIVQHTYQPANAEETSRLVRVVFDASRGATDGDGRVLKNPDLINPGMTLTLPGAAIQAAPAIAEAAPVTASLPPPVPVTIPAPPSSTKLTTTTTQTTTSAPRPADPAPTAARAVASEQPAEHRWQYIGIAGTLLAAGVAAEIVRRRRQRQDDDPRPGTKPAPIFEHLQEVSREVFHAAAASDATWLALELQHLYNVLPRDQRATTVVQLVQVHTDRRVEVALTEPGPAPEGWRQVADRVWQLDKPTNDDTLATLVDDSPVLPCLVTLGDQDKHGNLLLNLETASRIQVTGEPAMCDAFINSIVWELAHSPLAERPDIILNNIDIPGNNDLENVSHRPITDAIDLLPQAPDPEVSIAAIRTESDWVAYNPLIIVSRESVDLPARSDVVVVTTGDIENALVIRLEDGRLFIDDYGLFCDAQQLTAASAVALGDLIATTDAEPEPDDLAYDIDEEVAYVEQADDDADVDWQPPSCPIMVHLLGPIHATVNGEPLKLTPQELSALAYIAVHRKVSVERIACALWNDAAPNRRRVRDLLYQVRKVVGKNAVSELEASLITAGPDLGCDLDTWEALANRIKLAPHEADERRSEMAALDNGPVFEYPEPQSKYWAWISHENLDGLWATRLA